MEEIVVLKGVERTEKGPDLDLVEEGREKMRNVAVNEEVNQVIKGQHRLVANVKEKLDQAPVVPVDPPGVAQVALAQVAVHPPAPILQDQDHGIRRILEINQEKKNLSRKNRKVSPKTAKLNILKARKM